MADYLEGQADELEEVTASGLGDQRLVSELAAQFASMARAHGLHFIAERFDRFVGGEATGTHGA